MHANLEKLKYPIGKFEAPLVVGKQQVKDWIGIIQNFPERIKREVQELTDKELESRYRPNGWTIKQVVHHCADSHMNSVIRFKLALTEDRPTIKPYFENLWAELSDSENLPVESSLKIIDGLHERWVSLLKALSVAELDRQFMHPETNEYIDLKTTLGIYAWHCEHHLAHIKIAKENDHS